MMYLDELLRLIYLLNADAHEVLLEGGKVRLGPTLARVAGKDTLPDLSTLYDLLVMAATPPEMKDYEERARLLRLKAADGRRGARPPIEDLVRVLKPKAPD